MVFDQFTKMINRERVSRVRLIDKIAMFMIGIINNTPYVIGIASAQRIVKGYDKDSYLGIVLWANTISGIFSRFINSWLISMNVAYEINFIANLLMMLFGLLACAFSRWFSLTCVGIFFIGFSSNLGESVMLCYMTFKRKTNLLKSWSSGTGMAGIAGAGYSFICDVVNMNDFWAFIGVTPVVVLYGLLFFLVIWRSPEEDEETDRMDHPILNDENSLPPFIDGGGQNGAIDEEAPNVKVTVTEYVGVCDCSYWGSAGWLMFNCGAVYFLEYVMQGVFADCCLTAEKKKKYHYMYSLLNLMYQIGVFLSRSSLSFFTFPKIWILTLGQCVFFALWCTQAFFHFMPVGVLLGTMVCVGLFGGCSYVNAFHMMMNDETMTTKQKEMVTSWNSFFISLFIVLSTLFTFVAEMTFLIPPSIDE
ncbi:CLN3 protein [Tritrichomonas foetus]|uniref:CLN3 protein n=1 Tax=Tritrichomonas foetus TaxID=1144522 RepID=A0A1J4JN15_9EUKA|nr:CLN3 protein [Tritrichomonas foetus]|eukprot:OHS98931.1 CLN3 protein [Tritrichomonas foetus]